MSDETVAIERLAAGGDGVGHLGDGMTVFVPRTAPGDLVRLTGVVRRRRHAFARVAELVAAAAGRVAPLCRHFRDDSCGGCQWQHLSAETQRSAKARLVGDALRRIGKLAVNDPPLVESPAAFGYRGTVTLTVAGQGAARIAGFHREGGAEVFPLDRCEIAAEPLNALWAAVRPAVRALPGGNDVRLALRVTPAGALHLMVRGGEGAWTLAPALEGAARAAGFTPTVWWQPTGGAVRRMAGPEADAASVGFEQVNAAVADTLRADVLAALPATGRVLDLYAGAGAVGLALAERGCAVVAVEVDPRAVRATKAHASGRGLRLRAVAARVEDVLAGLLPADAVLVNPPRTGLEAAASAALAAAPPARLVYVSCDPATLSRDLVRLGATAERLTLLRAYDMFPQTSHVETLAVLDR